MASDPTPPKCADCGGRNPHVFEVEPAVHIWLCAACEYRRTIPNPPMVVPPPRMQRAAPLQREKLW